MGCMDIDKIYVAWLFGRYLIPHSKGCEQYGFRLSPAQRLAAAVT
jgi:hypothetical protein